jgi:hypothetical protein
MRVGESLERQHLLALLAAFCTAGYMPIQLVHQFIGQLSIGCGDHPFVC